MKVKKFSLMFIFILGICTTLFLLSILFMQFSNRNKKQKSDDSIVTVTPTISYVDPSEENPIVKDSIDTSEKGVPYKLLTPSVDDSVICPFDVKGEIPGYWFFEASFPVSVNDQQDNELIRVSAQTKEEWMTEELVEFKATINCEFDTNQEITLILHKSNVSDNKKLDDKIEIPLHILPQQNSIIEVFFHNTENDPDMLDCSKVYPVKREIEKTEGVGRVAVNELLKGPSQDEENEGYTTSIPQGAKLQSLRIEGGIAYADFNELLDYQVGGSCRVENIRSQISQTLKQFPTVNKVIISINDESDDILQP